MHYGLWKNLVMINWKNDHIHSSKVSDNLVKEICSFLQMPFVIATVIFFLVNLQPIKRITKLEAYLFCIFLIYFMYIPMIYGLQVCLGYLQIVLNKLKSLFKSKRIYKIKKSTKNNNIFPCSTEIQLSISRAFLIAYGLRQFPMNRIYPYYNFPILFKPLITNIWQLLWMIVPAIYLTMEKSLQNLMFEEVSTAQFIAIFWMEDKATATFI